jgi:IclR family transcriptional regulator, pca regulon regulatory protein
MKHCKPIDAESRRIDRMVSGAKALRKRRVEKPLSTAAKNSIQSLSKAFRLLEAVAASDADMTLSEIGRASALDPGTTYRILNTLVELGYVSRVGAKQFGLTLKVLDLGFRAIGQRELRTLARPLLRSLVGEVSEVASLGVLHGSDVLYVERMRAGITRLGVDIRVGTLIPAVSTVIGWAILAFLPEAELVRVLRQKSVQRDFPEITTIPDLRERLANVRNRGYALSASQISNGLAVLSVPVRDQDGHPVAAISVAAPSVRMKLDELQDRVLGSLVKASRLIARGLEANGGTAAG